MEPRHERGRVFDNLATLGGGCSDGHVDVVWDNDSTGSLAPVSCIRKSGTVCGITGD